jgi:DNA-binding response OmpR family regulator
MTGDVQKHILCVDGDWEACEACQTVAIVNSDIRFTFAYDYEHALTFIRRGVFDLYLIESWLPDGSGIDLCGEIRRTDSNTPVIVLVRDGQADDHELAIEAGASVTLDQPAGLFRIEGAIRSLLQQSDVRSYAAKREEIAGSRSAITERLSKLDARLYENT